MDESGARAAATDVLRPFMEDERRRVDAALGRLLPAAETPPGDLHAAMRHSVFAGGKRVRPLLVIAAARACGTEPDAVLPAACAVELIHTYSLIHDDLPAFDDEELRRGQPTCHVLWGDAVAILAGDALQALAFEHLATAGRGAAHPGRWLRAIEVVGRAAGSIGMCGGQTFDIQAPGADLDLDDLRRLHAAKTGALLTGSILAGGVLAGAEEPTLDSLRAYGDAIGLAFQVVDDLLDIEGAVADLGKRPGGDADRRQPTFPSLLGLDGARAEAKELRRRADAALEPLDDRADILRALAAFIVDRDR